MKPLSELTLLDRFLFSEAMEDPENLQTMLEIILGVENPEVILEDGGTRIFLNTHGTNPEEVSPELVELLYYIEHTNEKSESLIESARIRGLRERVNKIKEDEEVGARYMQEWEEREIAKREARAVGQAEGITEERRRILKLIKEGYSLEELCEVLEKEKTVF